MNDNLAEKVRVAYRARYRDLISCDIGDVVEDVFGGTIVVCNVITKDWRDNEMCFIKEDGSVRIFSTTEELARFLEGRSRLVIIDQIFSRKVVSGFVFVLLIIFVFSTLFINDAENSQVVSLLGGVLGLAGGFFFGQKKLD